MKEKRYITLIEADYIAVECAYKEGKKHHYRERCQVILLSHQQYSIGELALMFNKQEDTIRGWFNRWEAAGLTGLDIQKGRDLKPKLSVTNVELVDLVKKSQRATLKVMPLLKARFETHAQLLWLIMLKYIIRNSSILKLRTGRDKALRFFISQLTVRILTELKPFGVNVNMSGFCHKTLCLGKY